MNKMNKKNKNNCHYRDCEAITDNLSRIKNKKRNVMPILPEGKIQGIFKLNKIIGRSLEKIFKKIFRDDIIYFKVADILGSKLSFCPRMTREWRCPRMTFSVLTLVAVLSIGIASESWAINCPNGTQGSDDADATNYCGTNCCWGIDSNNVLTITPALDSDNKPYTNVVMKENFGNEPISNNPVAGGNTTKAPWGSQWDTISTINIGEGITKTGDSAFQGLSNVKSVTVPASLESFGVMSFDRMPNMSSFTINETADNPSQLKSFGGIAVFEYSSSLSNDDAQKIIDTIAANNRKINKTFEIPEFAFNKSSLTSITLPEGLESIGEAAFQRQGYIEDDGNWVSTLTSIEFPSTLKEIGKKAFMGSAFTDLDIPDSVETIGYAAFFSSALEKLIISDKVNFAGTTAFNLADGNAEVLCRGDFEDCRDNLSQNNLLSKFISYTCNKSTGSCTNRYTSQNEFVFSNYGIAKDGDCNTKNYYFDGENCVYEPEAANRVCEHTRSGYVKVGDYCASPEVTYAKKRYTPAEANQWLKDDNNTVTITFKK